MTYPYRAAQPKSVGPREHPLRIQLTSGEVKTFEDGSHVSMFAFFQQIEDAKRAEAFAALPKFLSCPFPHEGSNSFRLSLSLYPSAEENAEPAWSGLDCDHIFMGAGDLWSVRCKIPMTDEMIG